MKTMILIATMMCAMAACVVLDSTDEVQQKLCTQVCDPFSGECHWEDCGGTGGGSGGGDSGGGGDARTCGDVGCIEDQDCANNVLCNPQATCQAFRHAFRCSP